MLEPALKEQLKGIFAGLELTTGDSVIVMDCDLQHL